MTMQGGSDGDSVAPGAHASQDERRSPSSRFVLRLAAQWVRESRRIAAFTGAGISAESGIPTYRDSDDSLWSKYDPAKFADIDYFLRDATLFWQFFRDVRYQVIGGARPNPGHLALAAMEKTGRLLGVITQNIDGLHQEAGSQRVVELHGNTRQIGCLDCDATFTMEQVRAQLEEALPPPCRACGGRLKPRVVFFGEMLPAQALEQADELTAACDLLIAIGSSLQVYPAAAVPELAKRGGARLILINKTPTAFDDLADIVLHESASQVLPHLAAVLAEDC